jgi:hypothetical protein
MRIPNTEKKRRLLIILLEVVRVPYLSDWRLGVDLTLELSSLVPFHHDGILGNHLHSGKV